MNIKKLKVRFWKWLYDILSNWALKAEWNCTAYSLCPYGDRCEICERCGRCMNHGEPCVGMTDEELAESRAFEADRRKAC